jgi:hypothetical protein
MPGQHWCTIFSECWTDDLNVLSWGDVVARHPIVLGLDTKAFSEFIDAAEAESSTHGKAV